MKLLHKFFLAFFITNIILVGLILVSIALNLSSEFNDFVTDKEDQHVADSKQQLIALYKQDNSWQVIIDDVQVWRDIVDQKEKRTPPPRDDRPKGRNKPEAPSLARKPNKSRLENTSDFLETGRRLSLYYADKTVIVGKQNILDNPHAESILVNNRVVGWLGLEPSKIVPDSPASEFLARQYHNYYLIAVVVIVMALVMAFLLSRHLVFPIKQIITGTDKLTKGDFATRIQKVTHDELGTLVDNFNHLASTLDQSQNKRLQWMSDTSHELRTPLTVLRSHLLAIQDGIFTADEKRIQLFIDQIDNLSFIVDDLHQLAGSDVGEMTYKKVKLNPIELLLNSLDNFNAKFELQSLKVDYRSLLTCDNCRILGDKDRLHQLFSNLLENTCRYTQSGGRVCINAHIANQQLELEIQDSFPGVPLEEQSKLFERFYRVEKSRNRNLGGSGLGLSLCKQIVEAHQGRITAEDSSLGGLNIKMHFPLYNQNHE